MTAAKKPDDRPPCRVFTHQGFGVKGRDTLLVECTCSTRVLATCTGTAAEKRARAEGIRASHERGTWRG